VWSKVSLELTGKDVQTGPVIGVMSFMYPSPNGDVYCKLYNQTLKSDALIIANIQTSAISQNQNVSQLSTEIVINNRTVGLDYQVAIQSGGGFSVSSSVSESAAQGFVPIKLCVWGKQVANWNVLYSLSVLQ
uniref:hypothetical protein n=1 Tax=unclassified Pseudomonas TaxID=196821 RepID=UPI001A91C41F